MKYSDWDMKMMALGEIGADLMGILSAVGLWFYLEEVPVPVRVPVVLVALVVVVKIGLAFVHIGYSPDAEGEET